MQSRPRGDIRKYESISQEKVLLLSGLSVLSGTSQAVRWSSNRHRSLPGRWASATFSHALTQTHQQIFLPAPSRSCVPGMSHLCAGIKAHQIWRGRKHTYIHTLTGDEKKKREKSFAFSLIPQSNPSPPFVWFHSFVSSFCFVPFHMLLLSISPSLCCHSSPVVCLCSPSFSLPIEQTPFFPIHPLILLASFQFPSAWTRRA